MRIAVSDYDGTLKINNAVSSENIAAITAWRKAGNLFGIATGRDLSLIMHEINCWSIPFDFLICVNGAILYDDKLNPLKIKNIPDILIREVLLHPAALVSMHYQLCIHGVNKLYIRSANSYFSYTDVPFKEITFEESLLVNEVQQISLAYATEAECLKCADEILADFKDKLSINLNGLFIDINKHGVNKLSGVLYMAAIQGWSTKNLLAIGDGENDVLMIQYFKGFSVNSASRKVINEAFVVYKSVGDMLMDNLP